MQCCSTNSAKISSGFTDKAPIFIDVSVNGSDFVKCSTRSLSTSRRDYGQSAVLELFVRKQAKISIKFTDRSRFLEHLSVKPRSKPLKSYGQTAIFDHFVRNRHFSNKPFTDKAPIFIDLSVNGSDFVRCSVR